MAFARQALRVEVEPVHIRRGRAVLQGMVKLPQSSTGVVKHAVEHDADIARVCLVKQLPEGWRAAQQRIDREIVIGMVAVVCRRGKNRVEIQRADP